ncbi:MAG TPA: Gfo/Idh/MocA family oxidoreductase, partial [Bacillota bacterium]|nr:Gfo/Idh/MocA family oxidoreductase [Bacillota bacterium]
MTGKKEGYSYAPKGKSMPVCGKNEFPVGVIGLDHGHIYGMCNGLSEAGADICMVWDPDAAKVEAFRKQFPEAAAARCEEEVLESSNIKLIASAPVPDQRGPLGVKAILHGKHYFTDKPPFVSMDQLNEARKVVKETGKKFGVYYSERLHVEAAVYAGDLVKQGAIGRVIHVMGCGPHRISLDKRPAWFFDKKRYGGILVDLGCHQVEQILFFAGASKGTVTCSRVANYHYKDYPDFEDYGDAMISCDNGAAGYFRVDW